VIVVCGEALVDIVPNLDDPTRYLASPGGSPANTAIAAARLGSSVSLMARLSRDRLGRLLRAHLAANGVDLSAAVTAAEPSSAALVDLREDGGAGYRFLVDGTADWQWTDDELRGVPEAATVLHAGSLGLALPPGGAAIERLLSSARERCTISLDPNVRPELVPDLDDLRTTMERCVAIADVVKASADDLACLYPGRQPVESATAWSAAGPALVVMTDGARGAVGLTPQGVRASVGSVAAVVVDTIGAGDTFAGAVLDWLARAGRLGGRLAPPSEDEVADLLRFASACAAITCSRPGADPPWRAELVATGTS